VQRTVGSREQQDGGEGVRDEALRRGADEVIVKPAPLARLRDAALRAMKKP